MPTNDTAPKGVKNPIKLEALADYWRGMGLSMTSRRYRQLADEGVVDRPKKGWVDAVKTPIQIAIYYQKTAESKGDSTHEEVKKQRDLEKLEMDRMERKKMEGSLIERSAVVDEFVRRVHIVKQDLLALPKGLAKWPEAKEAAEKRVKGILRTYSRKTGAVCE